MFGALVIEREPLKYTDLMVGSVVWARDAGAFAAIGLLIWLLVGLPRLRKQDREAIPGWQVQLFFLFVGLSALSYVVLGGVVLFAATPLEGKAVPLYKNWRFLAGAAGGLFALLAVALPFVLHLSRMSFRRIYALAKLSFKEAI